MHPTQEKPENKRRIALDIETAPAFGWETFENAALDHHRNIITIISVWRESGGKTFITGEEAFSYCLEDRLPIVTHGGRFDFKNLIEKKSGFSVPDFQEDTMLMALALFERIPETWLVEYEKKRKELNKAAGFELHREARHFSLKTLAPYFLGVEPFWEVANHADSEYALKDAKYTYDLSYVLEKKLHEEGGYKFYKEHLMPWARMLLSMELRGCRLDMEKLNIMEAHSVAEKERLKNVLDELWAPAYKAYWHEERMKLAYHYGEKEREAKQKLKKPTTERLIAVSARYDKLCEAAAAKLPKAINLDSPAQLKWLLKDHLKLDVETFDGENESTGKAVLNRLAGQGRQDVRTLMEYREHSKLASAFFPSYREKQWNGSIYTNFNMNIARTGRLSSNGPNLQQVPGELHPLFIAPPGYRLITLDLSGIEPVVVAYLSECFNICSLLINGGNFHNANLRVMLGLEGAEQDLKALYPVERDLVKEVGLSILYGAGAGRVEESSTKRGFAFSNKECKAIVRNMKEHYASIYEFKEQVDYALNNQKPIRNILGRPVVVKDRASIYMTGFNTLVQSSASDMMLEGMKRAYSEAPYIEPLMIVHDEGIWRVPENKAEEGFEILKRHLTSWNLETKWGPIPVNVEGKISNEWCK